MEKENENFEEFEEVKEVGENVVENFMEKYKEMKIEGNRVAETLYTQPENETL